MIDTDQTNNNNSWNIKNKNILKILDESNKNNVNNQSTEYFNLKYKKNWVKKKKKVVPQVENLINNNKITKNRILCFNMLNSNNCSYFDKCIYAHSLEEQTVDQNRQEALNILKMEDLKNCDLIKNYNLKTNLLVLTKLCNDCINKVCPGGYNCKYGACNKEILICNNDFYKGDCKNFIENNKCINGVHLTLYNLVPLVKQELLYNFPDNKFILQKDNNLKKKKKQKYVVIDL